VLGLQLDSIILRVSSDLNNSISVFYRWPIDQGNDICKYISKDGRWVLDRKHLRYQIVGHLSMM